MSLERKEKKENIWQIVGNCKTNANIKKKYSCSNGLSIYMHALKLYVLSCASFTTFFLFQFECLTNLEKRKKRKRNCENRQFIIIIIILRYLSCICVLFRTHTAMKFLSPARLLFHSPFLISPLLFAFISISLLPLNKKFSSPIPQ